MDLSIITDLERERDDLRANIAALHGQMDGVKHANADLSTELHRVNALCNTLRAERDRLKEQIAEMVNANKWDIDKEDK